MNIYAWRIDDRSTPARSRVVRGQKTWSGTVDSSRPGIPRLARSECHPDNAICYFVSMRLVINGKEQNYTAVTLDGLIEELGMKGDRVAVELNREIVPRGNWSATALQDGDRLEIVHFVGGGAG
jgi:thiamine biosynthesis protein ThiS